MSILCNTKHPKKKKDRFIQNYNSHKAKESADVDVYINLIATRLSSRKGLFPYFFLIFSPFLKYFFIDRLYLYCC